MACLTSDTVQKKMWSKYENSRLYGRLGEEILAAVSPQQRAA